MTTTYTDPQGNVVPAKYVKPYDKERDRIARRILAKWEKAHAVLTDLKSETYADIAKLQALAEKTAGVTLGGKMGNVQFRSFDGSITVAIDMQPRTEFDERLALAQKLIFEAVSDITKNTSDANLLELVTRSFQPRKSGRFDMQKIRQLRTYKVDHDKWRKGVEIIAECERRIGSRQYVRVLRRYSETTKPQPILLDIAAIPIAEA